MTFKTQLQADLSVFFNADEFAAAAVLTTISGDEFDVKIVRTGQTDLLSTDPGQSDSDTFEVCRTSDEDEIIISPNDKFTLEDESVWVVQIGVRYDDISGTWTAPVLSDGRVKA